MNPNIPPDVLINLAAQFPRQVFNNPAIDLLLLETPNLFSGTSADALCSLLKRELSERMIEYALDFTDERLKLAILMNPKSSQNTLKELAKYDDCLTRQYVAGNPNTSAEILLNICFEFPNEVINNPVIPLLLLEDPHILTCKIPLHFNEVKRLADNFNLNLYFQ